MKARATASTHVSSAVMTVVQVAEFLQVNKLTVYRYIRTGELPAVRLGRGLRIMRDDLDRFLAARRVPAASVPVAVADVPRAVVPQPDAKGTIPVERWPQYGAEDARVTRLPREHTQAVEQALQSGLLDLGWIARGLH